MVNTQHNSISHEPDSTNIRAVGVTGAALAIGIAIILLIVYGGFQYLFHHRTIVVPGSPLAETDQQQFPPPPRIEEHPANELRNLHEQEDRVLSTYGWVNKAAGVVRIPIEDAMELQLERGFPARKGAVQK